MKRLAIPAAALSAVAIAAAAYLLVTPFGGTAQAQENLTVGVGVGEGTVSGNVFAPGEFTVATGDTVTFEITSDEAHTVTFGEGPEGVPPFEWPNTFDIEESMEPVDLGPVDYDGTNHVNTGVIASTSTVDVTFTEEGSFQFSCVIHPGMEGTVNVVGEGEDTTSQEEADAAAQETEDEILGAVDGLRQAALDAVETEERDDGTKLHKIFANTRQEVSEQPGGGTGYLELFEFIPPELDIKEGDTVQWEASTPHTVTFLPEEPEPQMLNPFGDPAKPSEEYDGESFYSSGLLGLGAFGVPEAPSTFELTFNEAGNFAYLCLLHSELGQNGVINVEEAPAGLPDTGASPGGGGGTGYVTWLAIAAGLALAFGSLLFLRRRLLA